MTERIPALVERIIPTLTFDLEPGDIVRRLHWPEFRQVAPVERSLRLGCRDITFTNGSRVDQCDDQAEWDWLA